MCIKTGHINGERVYVFELGSQIKNNIADEDFPGYADVQIVKHRDIVAMLRRFLRGLETADDEAMKRGSPDVGLILWGLLNKLWWGKRNFLPVLKMNGLTSTIPFDDPQKIKRAKLPVLQSEQRIDRRFLKPIVIKGGLQG